jgi:hypothetical protein
MKSKQSYGHHFKGAQTGKNLKVEIKWLGYSEPQWQSYGTGSTTLSEVGIVHKYLRRHNLHKLIPTRLR